MEARDRVRDPRRRLRVWMVARLAVTAAVLGVSWALSGRGVPGRSFSLSGIQVTVAAAFALTAVWASLLPRVRRVPRFAGLQLATDILVVTALVHFSGGSESFFSFLYLPITVYAAIFLDRRGAYGSACAASLAYGLALCVDHWLGLPSGPEDPSASYVSLLALWAVHAGALLLVALLSSALARELQRADRALDRSTMDLGRLRRLHERTVQSLTSGLLTTDPAGVVTSWNAEAGRITGVPLAEAVGCKIDEILPGARERVMSAAEEPRAGRKRSRMSYRSRRGESLHLGMAGSVLREEDGSPAGWVVIFQDVTQVVEMEKELRRTERLAGVGQLAADMAHEVRNPLAAISGSVQMLQTGRRGDGADPERRHLMEIVVREADRLDRLIKDFLTFARPSPPRCDPLRVRPLVQKVLEMFEAVRPAGVVVDVSIDPELRVQADAGQLTQLLWNLILNAVQAMPEGGRLGIAAAALEGPPQEHPEESRKDAEEEACAWAEIAISDAGTGIAPGVLDRIFDPFFTTKREGSGLGLATVARIVDDHGGSLRVESQVGRGTVFRVRLRRAEGAG